MQKTNFPFEVLIGDDASTDKTPQVIQEYASKYPEIIKPILRKKNIGVKKNARELYRLAKSPYLAICEGDDYWTDPLKLQKQVDFLDTHPDFSVCFHPVLVHWENGEREDSVFPSLKQRFEKTVLSIGDLLKSNFIQTNSVVYRYRFLDESLDILPCNIQPVDWFMHLLHAQKGKIGFLSDIMGVYRRHDHGIWYNLSFDTDKWLMDYGMEVVSFWEEVGKRFNYHRNYVIENLLFDIFIASLRRKNHDQLNLIKKVYPEKYKDIVAYIKSNPYWMFVKNIFISKIFFGNIRKIYRHRKRKWKEARDIHFLLKRPDYFI